MTSIAPCRLYFWQRKYKKKAKKVGFDWDNVEGPFAKINEELAELKAILSAQGREGEDKERIEEELGDLLFAVVNVARFIGFLRKLLCIVQSVNLFSVLIILNKK